MLRALFGGGGGKTQPATRPRVSAVAQALGPPITSEESQANLSELERSLNGRMKCHAGKNQVYIRSLIVAGATTTPRIALRCPLRKDAGLPTEVYYEHIRDACCSAPESCPALQAFQQRVPVT